MRKQKNYKRMTLLKECIHIMGKMKYIFFIAVIGFCILETVGSVYGTLGMRGIIQGLQNHNQDQVIQSFLYLLVVNLSWWIYMPIGQYMLDQTHNITMKRYKEKVTNHMLRLPMKYYDQTPKGEMISLLSNDMECLSTLISWNMEQLLRKIAGGSVGVLLMFALNPWFAVVVLLLGTTAVFTTQFFTQKMWNHAEQLQQKRAVSTCSFYELIKSAKNLRLLNLQSRKFAQVCESIQEEVTTNRKIEHLRGRLEAINVGIQVTTYLGLIACGSYFVSREWSDWGTVVALIGLKGMTDMLFVEFPQVRAQMRKNLAGASRIFAVTDLEEMGRLQQSSQSAAKDSHSGFLSGIGDEECLALKMEHVTFGYDEKIPVLNDFSMYVRKHSLVVVEGESGRGKSTLVKLLLGLYAIQSGEIVWNVRKIAYVPQESALFRGTIYENLICANETATMEQIRQALCDAQALSFVEELPDGIQTFLLDDGNGLSGGQKQRLALARALVKDADILLLDEVTSALDKETTRSFMETLVLLKKNKTILFVTHDKTMETLADQIIQM